jgi:hypothetical protein
MSDRQWSDKTYGKPAQRGSSVNAQQLKLLAIILIVLGAALIIWGFNLSGSAANEVSRAFTGSSTDEVVYRYVAGAVSLAAGLFLFLRKK